MAKAGGVLKKAILLQHQCFQAKQLLTHRSIVSRLYTFDPDLSHAAKAIDFRNESFVEFRSIGIVPPLADSST